VLGTLLIVNQRRDRDVLHGAYSTLNVRMMKLQKSIYVGLASSDAQVVTLLRNGSALDELNHLGQRVWLNTDRNGWLAEEPSEYEKFIAMYINNPLHDASCKYVALSGGGKLLKLEVLPKGEFVPSELAN